MFHLVADVFVARALQEPQGCRRNVELGHGVLLDDVPVPREVRVRGGALKNDGGAAQEERSVHNVGVARHPADVAAAEEAVAVVDVEDVLAAQGGADQVAGRGMHDAFRFAGRAGGVEEEERVLRIHGLRGDVTGVFLDFLVPPQVATLGPRHVRARPFVHDAGVDIRTLLQGFIDNFLGADELAAALALVGRDDDLALRINDPVAQRVRRKPGENDGVHGADARNRQERDNGLRDHGQVDGHGFALLDALLFQHPRHAGHLAAQLAIGDVAALARLVRLVDDGDLVRVLERVAIDAIEGRVQPTTDEPGIVAVLERAGVRGGEILVERQQLAGHAGPKRVGVSDRFIVELLVLVEILQMRSRGVFLEIRLGHVERVDRMRLSDLKPLQTKSQLSSAQLTTGAL